MRPTSQGRCHSVDRFPGRFGAQVGECRSYCPGSVANHGTRSGTISRDSRPTAGSRFRFYPRRTFGRDCDRRSVGGLAPAGDSDGAQEAARRSQCSNNFKQVGLACQDYASVYRGLPSGINMTTSFEGLGYGVTLFALHGRNANVRHLQQQDGLLPTTQFCSGHVFIYGYICPSARRGTTG